MVDCIKYSQKSFFSQKKSIYIFFDHLVRCVVTNRAEESGFRWRIDTTLNKNNLIFQGIRTKIKNL